MINSFTDSLELHDRNGKNEPEQNYTSGAAVEIWEKFISLLSQNVKQSEIKTWFSVLVPKSFENNVLTIEVPSKDFYGMIEKRFNKKISSIIESGLLGENGKLAYIVSQESLFDENTNEHTDELKQQTKVTNFRYPYGAQRGTKKEQEPFSSNLLSRHTFKNFVKGESNDLAVVQIVEYLVHEILRARLSLEILYVIQYQNIKRAVKRVKTFCSALSA